MSFLTSPHLLIDAIEALRMLVAYRPEQVASGGGADAFV